MNENIHAAQVLPPRAMLFFGIVALHAVVAYFLANGLLTATIQLLSPPMVGVDVSPEQPRPPPVEKIIENPRFIDPADVPVPAPDVPLEQVTEPVFAGAITETPRDLTPPQAVTPVEQPIRLVGRNVMPNTEEYYPVRERREGVEGAAVVQACVNESGKLEGAPSVEATSGSAALDKAALRVARDGRYARAVRGDVPVPNCHRFRVIFSMH